MIVRFINGQWNGNFHIMNSVLMPDFSIFILWNEAQFFWKTFKISLKPNPLKKLESERMWMWKCFTTACFVTVSFSLSAMLPVSQGGGYIFSLNDSRLVWNVNKHKPETRTCSSCLQIHVFFTHLHGTTFGYTTNFWRWCMIFYNSLVAMKDS